MGTRKDIQSRRQFFKKIGTKTLPFLGAVVLGPTISLTTLTSCGCDGCKAACMDNCEGGCVGSCQGSATGSTCSNCSSSCSGSSTSNTCSSCANDCSSSCKETCKNTCTNTCEGSAQGKPTTGTIEGHEYVDLGLSVLWATCNIGANTVEDYGEFFAFADPTGQNVLDRRDDDGYHEKINLEIGQCISESIYDTAKYKWGVKWKMPTADECIELINNCTLKYYKSDNGDINYEIISKLNGNKIIMPGAGFSYTKDYTNRDDYFNIGEGNYWSGNVEEYSRGTTLFLEWNKARVSSNGYGMPYRDLLPIRPVTNRSNGNSSTCNGSCTANCSSDCTATCKNDCKTSCVGGCGNNCTGSCNDKCTKTCANNCYSNCYSGCTTTCADTCKAQTSQGCSNCSSDCSSNCANNSTSSGCTGCSTGCSSSCKTTCEGSCINGCNTLCGGQCLYSCGGTCSYVSAGSSCTSSTCARTCSSYCYSTCTMACSSSCQSQCIYGSK